MSENNQPKIPLDKIKKVPPHILMGLIDKAKEYLKNDEVMKKVCEEYGQPVEMIDYIPTFFKDLDVSAKTDHGIVYLNYKLLEDGDFFKDYSYLVHEYSHFFQQCFRTKPTQSADVGSYLDNPFEQEGFKNQVEYIANEFGEDEAENYVDDLLDHHEIEGKEKDEKKDILMEQI